MIVVLTCKATFVFLLGAALLFALPKNSPQTRHAVCTCSVILALLMPCLSYSRIIPDRFNFSVSAFGSVGTDTSLHLPLLPIWICGASLVLLRFLCGVAFMAWKTLQAEGKGVVRVANVGSPLVWGWLRPTILMPRAAEAWPKERWLLAVAHEQSHIDRGDLWTSVVAVLAEAVYWFNPLIWWLTARMREEQELACDERVLEQGSDQIAYAELLVAAAGMSEFGPLGCHITGGRSKGGMMERRLQTILNWKRAATWSRTKQWTALFGCVLCLTAGSLIALADEAPYKIGGDVSAPQVISKQEPQYTKQAKDAKIQGEVLLGIVITSDGLPTKIHVVKSLDPGLDEKAIEAVSAWRFKPAEKAGKPVPVSANIEVNFRLI